jgi:hypothetical protein
MLPRIDGVLRTFRASARTLTCLFAISILLESKTTCEVASLQSGREVSETRHAVTARLYALPELFIGAHNEALTVAVMCVSNEDPTSSFFPRCCVTIW